MTLTVQDLTTLDQSTVEQFRATETQLLAEYNPVADLKRGPLQDLVVTPKAALDAATQENIDLIRQSNSLLEINANPALADDDTVDRCLSNFGVTRKAAANAFGQVTIVLSALQPTVIPQNIVFTISGQAFQPTATYAGRVNPALVVSTTDVLIQAAGANFAFTIPVTAVAAGSAGNVKNASAATPGLAPARFVKAYAAGDFTGGVDQETNAQLIGRLQSGLAVKAWSNRVTIDALVRSQFPSLVTESVVGFGDPECLRDAHSVWPGHTGGRVDIYVRTSPTWVGVNLTKTATLVSVAGSVGTWQVTIGRDDAPGYYEVDRILLPSMDPTTAGFPAASDVRGLDVSVDETHTYFPDVISAVEAAYGRYQTATVQFVDTVTNASGLTPGVSTESCIVVCRTMPQVDEIQDFLGQRAQRPTMGDVLVKAAVPCYTSVGFNLNVQQGTTVDVAAVQAAVAAAVNTMGFTGVVATSLVSQTLHNLLGNALVSVTGVSLAGRVRRPDGTVLFLSDSSSLAPTPDPTNLVSAYTVAFLLNPSDVAVTVITIPTPSV